MDVPRGRWRLASGSWGSILVVYLFGVLGASTVSKIIPLAADLARQFATTPADFGWLVSTIALPAVVLAIPSGLLVDRLGPRLVMQGAVVLGILANLLYYGAPSFGLMQVARVLEGTAIVHLYTAVPAFLMGTCAGRRRGAALSVWATYMPTGTAVGLLLAGSFAGHEGWRSLFLVHAGAWALVGLLNLAQPMLAPSPAGVAAGLGERLRDLRIAYSRPALLLLALAFFLMISLGFGANSTFPGYFARLHDVSVATSSAAVAAITLLMIPGSLLVGALVARGIPQRVVFVGLAVIGTFAGSLAFHPALSTGPRLAVVGTWFVVSGAAIATLMSTLPLVAEPRRRGSAAALLNQSAATATFVNPPLWLPLAAAGIWWPFAALMAGGWLVSVAAVWGLSRFPSPEP
jgi:predicted MFS family arabinose efflux permease